MRLVAKETILLGVDGESHRIVPGEIFDAPEQNVAQLLALGAAEVAPAPEPVPEPVPEAPPAKPPKAPKG